MSRFPILPYENDVLLGRGGKLNEFVGNEKLRELARQECDRYIQSAKRGKSMISRELVRKIRCMNPPGRFLKRHPVTMEWEDVGDFVARKKTSQVLRDVVSIQKEKLKLCCARDNKDSSTEGENSSSKVKQHEPSETCIPKNSFDEQEMASEEDYVTRTPESATKACSNDGNIHSKSFDHGIDPMIAQNWAKKCLPSQCKKSSIHRIRNWSASSNSTRHYLRIPSFGLESETSSSQSPKIERRSIFRNLHNYDTPRANIRQESLFSQAQDTAIITPIHLSRSASWPDDHPSSASISMPQYQGSMIRCSGDGDDESRHGFVLDAEENGRNSLSVPCSNTNATRYYSSFEPQRNIRGTMDDFDLFNGKLLESKSIDID